VVIPGKDGVYVLQLNSDGLESQTDIVAPATDIVNQQTTITS
jgi:Probable lipoprotein LpqN